MPTPEELHAEGVTRFEAGDAAGAADLLRAAARQRTDITVLNDLAVVLQRLGEADEAAALLRACLALDPEHEDARANLEQLADARTEAWRSSATLGGDNPTVPERAYPGMPLVETMAEHATRYAMAIALVGRRRVLDVGCGTGYGSEMLTWVAPSVRGFDLWEPAPHERPRWPGGAQLTYGFDVCRDPLPPADAAVMFEVLEHLDDAPAALRNVFAAAPMLLASFPNPQFHGSHLNPHHVNDWPLEQVEEEVHRAATTLYHQVTIDHLHQPPNTPSLLPGRDPEAPFWVFQAVGTIPR